LIGAWETHRHSGSGHPTAVRTRSTRTHFRPRA